MKESAATIQAYLTQDLKLINSDKVLQWRKDAVSYTHLTLPTILLV